MILAQLGTFVAAGDVIKSNDAQETSILMLVHLDVAVAYSSAYKYHRDGIIEHLIDSEPLGKDNSVCGLIYNDGTFVMFVLEADAGASGTTTKVHTYTVRNAVGPAIMGTGIIRGSVIRIDGVIQ